MIERRLRAIGREAKALGKGRKRRYPAELRTRAISVAEEARRAGWAWAALSAAMDIGADSLQRWKQTAPRLAPALVPIEILPVTTFPAKLNDVNPAQYTMAAVHAARDKRVLLPHEYKPPAD